MSIDLPPPITPLQSPLAELRDQAHGQQEWRFSFQGFQLHIFGPPVVRVEAIERTIAAADNLSDAIRAVGYLYFYSGYPATVIHYAAAGDSDNDVYILASPGAIRKVVAPPSLAPFFSNLNGDAPLSASALEMDRDLADILTERAGQSFKPSFQSLQDGQVALVLGDAAAGRKSTDVMGTFSNYGNRYAGPYLTSAILRQSFPTGDEVTVSGAAGTRFLGLGGSHSLPYDEADASWSRVTTLGVFSLNGQYGRFQLPAQNATLDGRLESGNVAWLYPLYADFQQRVNLESSFIRDRVVITGPGSSSAASSQGLGQLLLGLLGLAPGQIPSTGDVFSEQYDSVQLHLSYAAKIQRSDHEAAIEGDLILKKGLGPRETASSSADLGYVFCQPSIAMSYGLTSAWKVVGEATYRWSNDTSPLQQQYTIGGPSSLHAFRAGTGIGDKGENARMSLGWKANQNSWAGLHGVRPSTFIEYASTSLRQRDVNGSSGTVLAADFGTSVDMAFTSWLGGSLSAAQSVYSHGANVSPDGLQKNYVFFQLYAKY